MKTVSPILKTFVRDFVIITFGLAGLGSLLVAVIFHLTARIVTPANEFFEAIEQNNIDVAYGYLSEDFQANMNKAELDKHLNQKAIMSFKKANWKSRFIEGDQGGLVGTITTQSGDAVPIELAFIKEEDSWKISSIEKSSVQATSLSPLVTLLMWSAGMAILTTATTFYFQRKDS